MRCIVLNKMEEYHSSHSEEYQGAERVIFATTIGDAVLKVTFNNGTLTPYGKKNLEFTCYKNTKGSSSPFPERILVTKSKRLCYVGSNFDTQTSKVTSSVLKLLLVNKKDSTFKMYDADFFALKPYFKSSEMKVKAGDKSYVEKSSDLTLAFGSKSQQKRINTTRKYGNSPATSDSVNILTISETDQILNVNHPAENSISSVIPPRNNLAQNVEDVYNLYDIISVEELNAMTSNAQVFLDTKHETLKLWEIENKYSPFIIQFIESSIHDMNLNKAKLLCYLHYMFCFLRTGYADWRKKDPVPDVPEPFKQKLMDSFTVKKSMPLRLKDKLLAHTMVLALKLCNNVFNCNTFSSSSKIPMTRITSVAYDLGCRISVNKNNGMKTIELKLPLYKFKSIGKKRKRP